MSRLIEMGAEGIILGCTELALLVGAEDCRVPLFDTTRIHALAAVDHALNPKYEAALGSTGNLPVPSGYQPGGTMSALTRTPTSNTVQPAADLPSGRLPLGTGKLPVLPIICAVASSLLGPSA